jgi:hypothetical protein
MRLQYRRAKGMDPIILRGLIPSSLMRKRRIISKGTRYIRTDHGFLEAKSLSTIL